MKKVLFLALLIVLSIGVDQASAHPHGKGNKQFQKTINQHARIYHGVRTGQITPIEAKRLRGQQRTISAMKRVASADGRITRGERMVINRAQRHASRTIYRMKHNGRMR